MNGLSPDLRDRLTLRLIDPKDNPTVTRIIRQVMTEFGAVGSGYAIQDPEVDQMAEAYVGAQAEYWVIVETRSGQVLGGGGVAPLKMGRSGARHRRVGEIQKMYFLPELRGLGWGKKLLSHLIERARELGFEEIYLETLHSMVAASHLYESCGFVRLLKPKGETGHTGCNRWYSREL